MDQQALSAMQQIDQRVAELLAQKEAQWRANEQAQQTALQAIDNQREQAIRAYRQEREAEIAAYTAQRNRQQQKEDAALCAELSQRVASRRDQLVADIIEEVLARYGNCSNAQAHDFGAASVSRPVAVIASRAADF